MGFALSIASGRKSATRGLGGVVETWKTHFLELAFWVHCVWGARAVVGAVDSGGSLRLREK
jgi:hypothetical protein